MDDVRSLYCLSNIQNTRFFFFIQRLVWYRENNW